MLKSILKKPVYAFVDASNLFYGGQKSLGWKIDYKKLLKYLKDKYGVSKTFYYGGIEMFNFKYSILDNKLINLRKLLNHLLRNIKTPKISGVRIMLIEQSIQRTRFYLNLEKFGYNLKIKPVKTYKSEDGRVEKKANCDVDMTFDIMRYMAQYKSLIALTGDGDFAPVFCYLKKQGRDIKILARGERTARELKQLVGSDFRDFVRLKKELEYKSTDKG